MPIRTPRIPFAHLLALLLAAVCSRPAPARAHLQPDPPQESPEDTRRQRALERLQRLKPDQIAEESINELGELPAIDPDDVAFFDDLTTRLADDSLAGRFPGTPGIDAAADMIQAEFEALGLTPLFSSTTKAADGTEVITPFDSYRQPLDRGMEVEIRTGRLTINAPEPDAPSGPSIAPTRGATHQVSPLSGSGEVTGPIVFCGYAVTAGPGDYMNFPVDANYEGKIVLILEGEPMTPDGRSRWAQDGWSLNTMITAKISAVTRRGAEAVLVARPPALPDGQPEQRLPEGGRFENVPILNLSRPFADALLARADPQRRTLAQLAALADDGPTVLDLDACTVTVAATVDRTPKTTDNLGAMLPGRGPLRSEYVLVGAHYDHVGTGAIGSSDPGQIHPGADDNASGTAAMLLVARDLTEAYAALPDDQPARSVLFLAFTAEETGLEGSRHYVTRPPLPLDDHALMLNLDMVGRMRDGLLELGGLNSADSLEDFVNPRLDESGLRIRRGSSIGDNRSDHASFDARQVPNLFFFTGLHDEYHTPQDTPDLLNDEGAVRIADLVAAIALDAAKAEQRLAHARARRAIGAPIAPKVRVGIIPAPDPEGGLSVRQVSPNTSASRAGLQTYDRITHWNGEPLDLDRFSRLLVESSPGQTVTLTVVRDDEEIEIEMTLSAQ
ncbi:MAG: M28 family peptidase [Phycisphaerales bacterium JB040]